jgi:DNA-binding SARP family transcriptional activator
MVATLPTLYLRLLGGFEARLGSGPALGFPTRKAQALLAYLALGPEAGHPRDKLTALLWSDSGERQARQSLRQALFNLRKTLASAGGAGVLVEGEVVGLAAPAVEVDARLFERAAQDGSRAAMERAVSLYSGDLLEGLAVNEPAFEEWLVAERERLRELARGTVTALLSEQTRAGLLQPSVQTALRLLALDPLDEAGHRSLMRLYARQGRRGAALRQYQVCVDALRRDLGVEPEPETRRVYQEILQRGQAEATEPVPPAPAARPRLRPPRVRAGGPLHETPMVGREAEAAWLVEALGAAWQGDARVVLVIGEAGIGKSRLVAELTAEAARRDGRVLLAGCHETEQSLPFRPWVDALREGHALADPDLLAGLSAVWQAELARLFPELGGPSPPIPTTAADHVRLFEAVAELTARLTAQRPLLVALEDLHWADEMTLRLLAFLGRRLRGRPVLLVGTAREEELGDATLLGQLARELDRDHQLLEMVLSPLSQQETERLVRSLAGGRAHGALEPLAAQIWAVSDGNPFVIVETVRALDERALTAGASMPLPKRVRELVEGRLARLAPPSRRLATVAAAAGGEASFGVLQQASGLDAGETAAAVEELVRRRMLDAVGEGFGFTNDRIRSVVYEGLPAESRRRLHADVAAALETTCADRLEDVYDRLAFHYSKAQHADKALTYLGHFAEKAVGRYALAEAARALGEALVFAERLPAEHRGGRVVDVVLRLATCLYLLGRGHDLLELLQGRHEWAERLEAPAHRGAFHFWLGYAHGTVGDPERAIPCYRRAIEEAGRCGDEATLGKAHSGLAREGFWSGRLAQAVEHGREAVRRLTPIAAERWWLGHAHWNLTIVHGFRGAFEAALASAAEARAIGDAIGDFRLQAYATWSLGWVKSLLGDHAAAIEACRQSLSLSPDDAINRGLGLGHLGYAYVAAGDAAQAIPVLEDSVQQIEQLRMTRSAARISAWLGEAWLLRGDLDRARTVATRALEQCTATGHRYGTGEAARTLGRLEAAAGDPAAAEARLVEALAAFAGMEADFEAARTHVALAEVRRIRGDRAGAAAALGEARALFDRLGLVREVDAVDRLAAAPAAARAVSAGAAPVAARRAIRTGRSRPRRPG